MSEVTAGIRGEVEIRLDIREPGWLRAGMQMRYPFAIPDKMPYGDIWVSRGDQRLVVVERKQINDFLNSMKKDVILRADGRPKIDRQLSECVEHCDDVILLLEGMWTVYDGHVQVERRTTGWYANAFMGKLRKLQADFPSVTLLPSPTRSTTLDILSSIIKAAGGK